MTVFRKAVLERKKNNITGVLFADTGTRKMKILLFFMLIIAMILLFISQRTIKIYTAAKISTPSEEFQKKESCFRLEYEKTKGERVVVGEFIGISINEKEHLTGVFIQVVDDNTLCVKLTKETNNEMSEIELGKTIFLWKYEKLWFFLYSKIKGSTGL